MTPILLSWLGLKLKLKVKVSLKWITVYFLPPIHFF